MSMSSALGELAADASLERNAFLATAGEQLRKFLAANKDRIKEIGGLVLIDDDPDYLSVAPDGSFRSRTRYQDEITGEWHARWRPFVLDRIKDETKQCRPGKHQNQDGTPLAMDTGDPGTQGSPSAARTLLAEVEYWWPFYAVAYHQDINERLAREDDDGNSWTPPPTPE